MIERDRDDFIDWYDGTVDGRTPTPVEVVEVGSLSLYVQVFFSIPGGCLGFLKHQQHDLSLPFFLEGKMVVMLGWYP